MYTFSFANGALGVVNLI